MLIVFGDGAGGVLLFTYLLVYGTVTYGTTVQNAIAKQRLNDLVALLPQVFYYCYYSYLILLSYLDSQLYSCITDHKKKYLLNIDLYIAYSYIML